MFSSDKFGRVAAAMIGTVIFTTISVGAAVGPARSLEINPVYASAIPAQNAVQANG